MSDAADDARDREEDAQEMKEAHDMGKCLPYCVLCLFEEEEDCSYCKGKCEFD